VLDVCSPYSETTPFSVYGKNHVRPFLPRERCHLLRLPGKADNKVFVGGVRLRRCLPECVDAICACVCLHAAMYGNQTCSVRVSVWTRCVFLIEYSRALVTGLQTGPGGGPFVDCTARARQPLRALPWALLSRYRQRAPRVFEARCWKKRGQTNTRGSLPSVPHSPLPETRIFACARRGRVHGTAPEPHDL
jgi:hypothetical protein